MYRTVDPQCVYMFLYWMHGPISYWISLIILGIKWLISCSSARVKCGCLARRKSWVRSRTGKLSDFFFFRGIFCAGSCLCCLNLIVTLWVGKLFLPYSYALYKKCSKIHWSIRNPNWLNFSRKMTVTDSVQILIQIYYPNHLKTFIFLYKSSKFCTFRTIQFGSNFASMRSKYVSE